MKNVAPLPDEEALYGLINSVLDAAAKDPQVTATLNETAIATDKEMFGKFQQWKFSGQPAGNDWNSTVNNSKWGTDYLNRATTGKTNIFENLPEQTKYLYRDLDAQGGPMHGKNLYCITFAKWTPPSVSGLWSLTLNNEYHFFKNKTLKYKADGSLTLYAGATSPGADKESNWLPAPRRHVLAFHARLLAGPGHHRRHLEGTAGRTREMSETINQRKNKSKQTT